MTKQLLQREPLDIAAPSLRYAGTPSAGGHPCTARLELVAVGGGRQLYALSSDSSAPRRWEEEQHFIAKCVRRFAHWFAQLPIVSDEQAWPGERGASLARYLLEVVAAEDAAARVSGDIAPVLALQRQVLDALRSGMGFFTAGKEGGSHLFFDGAVFRRSDYGDGPDLSAVYPDDASMLDCLRRFYDWDARQDSHPHPKAELAVWQYIRGRLRTR
ncbi:MAG: hypothetical protein H7Y62_13065 [Hyphomicrobium sp.]|nr:hypothetical protein [Hyphomicrobium sp.]